MRRYLLDTGVFTDLLNGRSPTVETAKEYAFAGGKFGICHPILGEIYYGIEKSKKTDRTIALLQKALRDVVIWPFDDKAAKEYGRIAAYLDKVGKRIKIVDMQIAAVALTLGKTTVVTKDKHFREIPDLLIEDWSKSESSKTE